MALRVCLHLALIVALVQGQRLADRKCKEYHALTTTTVKILPLTMDSKPITIRNTNCSKTVYLIAGGEVTKVNEFPHQAVLGWNDPDDPGNYRFMCGGSLISKRYVLTAAHCLKKGNPDIVRLGEHDIDDDSDNQKDFRIESIKTHPSYKFKLSYHDIALIRLKKDVKFSRAIRPACLWTGQNISDRSFIATGFGSIDTAGDGSKLLRKVVLEYMDRQLCVSQFTGQRTFTEGLLDAQLCIGSRTAGRDTCQGDSGGPIQALLDPKGCTYQIVAVTSIGPKSCGHAPALYTRVPTYLDWIEQVVWENE